MRRANFIVKRKIFTTKFIRGSTLFIASFSLLLFITNAKAKAPVVVAPVTPVPVNPVKVETPVIAVEPAAVAPIIHDEFLELEKRFQAQEILGLESVKRAKNSKSIRITLNSDYFFQLGTAKLEEASINSIQQIIGILKPFSSTSLIEIEGHTDDSPVIKQKVNYPTNWELSSARAASLVPQFSNNGFFKDQIKVIGYGDSRPLFSNHTSKESSARNRRIVLWVFAQEDERKTW